MARSEGADTSGGRRAIPFPSAVAGVVGAVFLLVGVAGFIPGATTDYDTMKFAGHDSEAELLGVFQVSILHNIVHLLFGLIGVAAFRRPAVAVGYLVGGGPIYLVLWLYGLLVANDADANFVPLNNADDWLHLGLGAAMVLLGLIGLRSMRSIRG